MSEIVKIAASALMLVGIVVLAFSLSNDYPQPPFKLLCVDRHGHSVDKVEEYCLVYAIYKHEQGDIDKLYDGGLADEETNKKY